MVPVTALISVTEVTRRSAFTTTYVILQIIISNTLEAKVTIETAQPTAQRVQHFCEGRVHVEIVFAPNVLCRKGSKVDLIEAFGRHVMSVIRCQITLDGNCSFAHTT